MALIPRRTRARSRWLALGVATATLTLVAASVALATGPVGTAAGFEDDDGNLAPAVSDQLRLEQLRDDDVDRHSAIPDVDQRR